MITFRSETDGEIELDLLQNEFTGTARESVKPPGPNERICLISYEITVILLGDGPHARSSFWRAYRRELELNRKTEYRNYHINLCQHQLTSLKMKLNSPVFFRDGKLTFEKQLDAATNKALAGPRFASQTARE